MGACIEANGGHRDCGRRQGHRALKSLVVAWGQQDTRIVVSEPGEGLPQVRPVPVHLGCCRDKVSPSLLISTLCPYTHTVPFTHAIPGIHSVPITLFSPLTVPH